MSIGTLAKAKLEQNLGLTIEQMCLATESESVHLQKLTGRPIIFSKQQDNRKASRGNALLASFRYTTMEEINFKIDDTIRERELRDDDARREN